MTHVFKSFLPSLRKSDCPSCSTINYLQDNGINKTTLFFNKPKPYVRFIGESFFVEYYS